MKDPGPNVLEQQIETNRLLALLIAAAGPPALAPSTLQGGAVPIQWPILFYWSNHLKHPFTLGGTGGETIQIATADGQHLSADNALLLKTHPTPATYQKASITLDLPPPPSRHVRVQMAFMCLSADPALSYILKLEHDTFATRYYSHLEMRHTNLAVYYRDAAGLYQELATGVWPTRQYHWVKIDCAINFLANTYHYFAIQHNQFDMSAIGLPSIVDEDSPTLEFSFEVSTDTTVTTAEVLIDEILITDELKAIPE